MSQRPQPTAQDWHTADVRAAIAEVRPYVAAISAHTTAQTREREHQNEKLKTMVYKAERNAQRVLSSPLVGAQVDTDTACSAAKKQVANNNNMELMQEKLSAMERDMQALMQRVSALERRPL